MLGFMLAHGTVLAAVGDNFRRDPHMLLPQHDHLYRRDPATDDTAGLHDLATLEIGFQTDIGTRQAKGRGATAICRPLGIGIEPRQLPVALRAVKAWPLGVNGHLCLQGWHRITAVILGSWQ